MPDRVPDLIDSLAAAWFAGPTGGESPAPGIAWGVVADGELVHAGGLGTLTDGRDRPVDADGVFRIASMTKSFTAAAILALRDDGILRLDDPVTRWVPDLDAHGAAARDGAPDAGPITIHHLLVHAGGFPTDDPWGDRQQGLDLESFAALLGAGPSSAWTPGHRFEYSNLGYSILGRVVTAAAGREYEVFVTERFLGPLGMTSSGYHAEAIAPGRLATGHVRRGGGWSPEPIDPYGAAAAMGGLFTTIRDLARWVAFHADAWPPRRGRETFAGEPTPLSRASRREMARAHLDLPAQVLIRSMTGPVEVSTEAYGYGLFIVNDPLIGRTAGHSGGYPGFGSNMIWHPATGLGVLVFGNARYCGVSRLAREALRALVAGGAAPVRRVTPAPAMEAARSGVEDLLADWDDAAARRLFAMNVELDEPLAMRQAAFEAVKARLGPLVRDDSVPESAASPFQRTWWLRGDRGRATVSVLLSPEPEPRIQSVAVTAVIDPSPALLGHAEAIVGALASAVPDWPRTAVLDPALDAGHLDRELRASAARYGPATLGRVIDGDGATRATWRVVSQLPVEAAAGPGWAAQAFTLTLALDAASGRLIKVALVPEPVTAPILDE